MAAQGHDGDVWFLVAKRSQMPQASFLLPPSMNAVGDLVVRRRNNAGNDLSVFPDSAQVANNGSTPPSVVVGSTSSSWILNSFPVVNASGLVARFTLANGFSTVGHHVPPGYTYTRIAQGGPTTLPFTFVGNILDLDSTGRLALYGEWGTTTNFKAIFLSATEITSPTAAPKLASTQGGAFSNLDAYVDASVDGAHVVFRGVSPTFGTGIFSSQGSSAVATDRAGWTVTGSRPATNSQGTVAFYGQRASGEGVFLWSGGASPVTRFAGSFGQPSNSPMVGFAPASYASLNRIAVNDLNQVAFVAFNADAKLALYSTNLGAMQELLAVNDTLAIGTERAVVTGLAHWDALSEAGQIAVVADVTVGSVSDQWLLRRNRASYQTKVVESPVRPSWWSATKAQRTGYLLRAVPNSGVPFKASVTLASAGCNLTSTANLLTFHGFPVTPIELQRWLNDGWQAATTAAEKNRYVRKATNDFDEDFVTRYTLERAGVSGPNLFVEFLGIYRNQATNGRENLDRVIRSLRDGQAVKLRVPNGQGAGYDRFGHYVLAYALKNPNTADSALSADDVLIHDPGNSGMRTLGDYGRKKGYDSSDPGWFEQNRTQGTSPQPRYRVYLYGTVPITRLPAYQPTSAIYVASPVDVLLVDPQGRRLGIDSMRQTYREIPGADYYEEDSYSTLDDEPPTERVWTKPDAAKWLRIPQAAVGDYRIEITGTGTGPYELHLSGGALGFDQGLIAGSATPNLRRIVEVTRLPRGVRSYGRSTPACRGDIRQTTADVPTTPNPAFQLRCRSAPPLAVGLLGLGVAYPTGLPIVGIDFYLDLALSPVFLPVSTDANGEVTTPLPLPANLQPGTRFATQYVWLNTTACTGAGPWSASNPLELQVQ